MAKRRSNSLPGLMVHLATTFRGRHPVLTLTATYLMLAGVGFAGAFFMMNAEPEPLQVRVNVAEPETCSGAVGEWVGYQTLDGNRYRFDLDIERPDPSSSVLAGSIQSHYWRGDATSSSPPACGNRTRGNYVIGMNANGSVNGDVVSFEGQDWKLAASNGRTKRSGYYPDKFNGKLSADGTEFHAINNDGVNTETTIVFRRTSCTPYATGRTKTRALR